MLRLSFFLLLFLTAYEMAAQSLPDSVTQRPNAYDADSLKTGRWVYYHNANGKPAAAGDSIAYYQLLTYVKGKPAGPFGYYYANGNPQTLGDSLLSEIPRRYYGALTFYGTSGAITNYRYYTSSGQDREATLAGMEALYDSLQRTPAAWDTPDEAWFLVRLAVLYYSAGRYTKAEPLYWQALNIMKATLGLEHPRYSISLNNLAALYWNMGRYAEAEPLYQQGLEIRKTTVGTAHPEYAESLNNLGLLYKAMGRYAEAEPLYRQALEIHKAAIGTQDPNYAAALNNLAALYQKMGRYAEAKPLFQQALEIEKNARGTNQPTYASYLNNLALLYKIMGRDTAAERLHQQDLAITKAVLGTKHPAYATALHNLAVLYRNMGRNAEAEPLFQQALEIQKNTLGAEHPEYAISLDNLGLLYQKMGRYAEAEPQIQQALDITKATLGAEHPSYANFLRQLAQLYEHTHRVAEALPLWEQVLAYHQTRLTTYFDHLGESERRDYYVTVDYLIEQYTGLAIAVRDRYPQLLGQALNLQLQHKALLLSTSNQIKRRILASGDRKLIDLYNEVQALKQQLGRQHSTGQAADPLDSLRQVLHQKEQALTAYSTEYKTATMPATWQAVQAALGKREALVELVRYRVADDQPNTWTDTVRYAAFIITAKAKQPQLVELPNGNALEQEALAYYQNAIRYQLEDAYSYASFWEPLKAALKRINKVYLSPDGVYHKLNLETLYNPETGQYLYQELDLQLITSGRVLLAMPRAPMQEPTALLMGSPNFNAMPSEEGVLPLTALDTTELLAVSTTLLAHVERGNGLAPLPGTAVEVERLKALLEQQGWQYQTLLGTEATEEALKTMTRPKVLHIATHGFFQEKVKGPITYATDPLYRSGLLLSGAANTLYNQEDLQGNVQRGKEDGILTAFEAKFLNVDNTDLVVLSACETGLGEIRNGEGVYGLQRAFTVAGARSILMSLWKVNDQTTQELMVSFYTYWLGGATKRAALRQAQLDLQAKYPHPYYWGAFVLVGE